MNELNNIFSNYGIRLKEEGEDQEEQQVPEEDPNQQSDQETQDNAGSGDDIDPNNDPSINPNPTIADDKFKDIETIERLNVIKDLIKLSAVLNKIKSLKYQVVRFDLNETILIVQNVIDNIDLFATDDILKFKEVLLNGLDPKITMLKSNIKECEGFLTENEVDFILNFSVPNVFNNYRKLSTEESLKELDIIKSYLYKIKKSIEADDSIHFKYFDREYNARQSLLLVKDAINMIEILKKENGKIYHIDKVNFVNSELSYKDIAQKNNKIWFIDINNIPRIIEKDHFLYVFYIRNLFINQIIMNTKEWSNEKLFIGSDKHLKFTSITIKELINNTLKIDISVSEIEDIFKKYKIEDFSNINIFTKLVKDNKIDEKDIDKVKYIIASMIFINTSYDSVESIYNNKFVCKILNDSYLEYSSEVLGYKDSLIVSGSIHHLYRDYRYLTHINHVFRGLQFLFSIPKYN